MTYTDRDGETHETPLALFLAHNFTHEKQMGGGCQALAFYADDGTYWLVTDYDDPGHIPAKFSDRCSVGRYDNDQDHGEATEEHEISVTEALALIWYGDQSAAV
ncbi:hypothetical protein LCGC14_2221190 [marine sediment metagenome]|uniref:Uncharacterized protein n=1 Tax=marine sediment metagenome TaxID=412755 RepID=A0A0F9DAX4_9ZZZZ